MARKMRDIMSHRLLLPGDRESLAGLLAASGQPARLAATLVRVSLSQRAPARLRLPCATDPSRPLHY
jgi:hypothetical protein